MGEIFEGFSFKKRKTNSKAQRQPPEWPRKKKVGFLFVPPLVRPRVCADKFRKKIVFSKFVLCGAPNKRHSKKNSFSRFPNKYFDHFKLLTQNKNPTRKTNLEKKCPLILPMRCLRENSHTDKKRVLFTHVFV